MILRHTKHFTFRGREMNISDFLSSKHRKFSRPLFAGVSLSPPKLFVGVLWARHSLSRSLFCFSRNRLFRVFFHHSLLLTHSPNGAAAARVCHLRFWALGGGIL